MSTPRISIFRAPRVREYFSTDPLEIPAIERPSAPQLTTLIVSFMGLLGLAVSVVVYTFFASSGSGVFILGFVAISGVTALGSLITFFLQLRQARRDAKDMAQRYRAALLKIEEDAQIYADREIKLRNANDPALVPLDVSGTWQRKPTDNDFLRVRLGHGAIASSFHIQLPTQNQIIKPTPPRILFSKVDFAALEAEGVALSQRFAILPPLPAPSPSNTASSTSSPSSAPIIPKMFVEPPITVPLLDHRAVAVIGADANSASFVLRELVGQVVLHHSPHDVKVFVFADDTRIGGWQWLQRKNDPGSNRVMTVLHVMGENMTAVGGSVKRAALLESLQKLLLARSNDTALAPHRDANHLPVVPHYVIVVDIDDFGAGGKEDGHAVLTGATLMLALREPACQGVTVLSRHTTRNFAPQEASLLLICESASTVKIVTAGDEPTPPLQATLDTVRDVDFEKLGDHLRLCVPEVYEGLELPPSVSLLQLLGIADPAQENFAQRRQNNNHAATIKIPIGRMLGNEPLELDLTEKGAGPHGLLIGKTGSGKSELLRSIIMALAIQYPPDVLNFVLVDYKGGAELDAFRKLPHTVAFLTDMTQAGQTNRFLRMMDAELNQRTTAPDKKALPHLFVVIDEFAEMVTRRGGNDAIVDTITEKLIRIVRIGRSLNVHLLFATQRPEVGIIQRLRGYVQYRLCLRTNTPDDSNEVIDRPDAANLPAAFPGRGYLLRGDNELTQFQAARIVAPPSAATAPISQEQQINELVVSLELLGHKAQRWPDPLPSPTPANLSPIILMAPPPGKVPTPTRFFTLAPNLTQPLRMPLGIYDRPAEIDKQRQQGWFWADLAGYTGRLSGGPLMYVGDLNAGKTTALQTLLTYFTCHLPSSEVRLFVLDPNEAMDEFRALPHCQDWHEAGRSTIISGTELAEFEDWKKRLQRHLEADPTTRPAAVVVVDEYDDIAKRLPQLQEFLLKTYSQNRKRRLHLVVAAAQISYEHQTMYNLAATKVLLYMGKKDNYGTLLGGNVPFFPDAVPGRGFVLTRSGVPDEIQLATPTLLSGNEQEWEERMRAILATRRLA